MFKVDNLLKTPWIVNTKTSTQKYSVDHNKMTKTKSLFYLCFKIFLLINLHKAVQGYENYPQHSYQNYAHSFNAVSNPDSRYFKHGTRQNEISGGTCNEFLRINTLNMCCSQRDDDCYMIHYDTRCYCDVFCDRSNLQDNSDCCDDAVDTCSGNNQITTPEPTCNVSIYLLAFFYVKN